MDLLFLIVEFIHSLSRLLTVYRQEAADRIESLPAFASSFLHNLPELSPMHAKKSNDKAVQFDYWTSKAARTCLPPIQQAMKTKGQREINNAGGSAQDERLR